MDVERHRRLQTYSKEKNIFVSLWMISFDPVTNPTFVITFVIIFVTTIVVNKGDGME